MYRTEIECVQKAEKYSGVLISSTKLLWSDEKISKML